MLNVLCGLSIYPSPMKMIKISHYFPQNSMYGRLVGVVYSLF